MEPRPNRPSHLKALLKKNFILYTRSWCGSILEILVPLLFAVLMLAFRGASPVTQVGQTTYYNSNSPYDHITVDNALTLADVPYIKNCKAQKNGGRVALAPRGNDFVNQLNTIFTAASLETQIFDNNQQIDEYTSRLDYASGDINLCFGVIFNQNGEDNKYEYLLRWNTSSSQDIPDPNGKRLKAISWANMDSFTKYLTSGFLVVQGLVDNLILQKEIKATSPNAAITATLASRTVEAYKKDDLATNLKGQTRLFLDLPLLLPYLRFINNIIREKEKRIREGMKIMGLKNSAFYLAWFITYILIFSIISILVSLVLVGGFFKNSALGYVFLWHWEFSMCLMSLGFLVTVFFNKAKVGNVAGFVLVLVLGFFQQLIGDDSSAARLFFASIAPQTSLGLSADHILNLEAAQLGLTSQTVKLEVQNYKIVFHYVLMFVDTVVFLLLGSYLDQVLPSEFGIRKHPCFCLMRRRKRKAQDDRAETQSILENQENYEEADPNLVAQDDNGESIMIKNLKKVFSNGKVAVDGVSFNMYKGQIFTLLGHNGAGKTTSISMITGLFKPTKGTVQAFGKDIRYELEEVRKTMGVCPQHDILFDSLTVKEHLELYAVFKGVPSKEIQPEVEKIIEDIGLSDKRDYLSKNLSGGQKRKLSVGIAFIGGSKFILLDEPSSGMDTSARRRLWEMLKNYKNNRVVLLTTHFMDEADYLGDRIGIMGEGKLKCLGSSLFLKTKFGVGYNLTLIKKSAEVPNEPIRNVIKTHLPQNNTPPPVGSSAELEFQLPIESASKFRGLFDNLESQKEKLGIVTYGISVTTLEEVFLKIAEITVPEKHFQKQIELTGFIKDEIEDFSLHRDRIKGSWNLFRTHFWALVVKRFHYLKRDKRGLCCELFLPILMVIVGILIAKANFFKDIVPLPLTDNLYGYKFDVQYNKEITTGTPLDPAFLAEFNKDYFNLVPDPATSIGAFDTDVFNYQEKDVLHSSVNVFSFFVTQFDTTNDVYKYTALLDTRAQEAAPFAMNKINSAILKLAANKEINTVVAPFLRTKGTAAIQNVISGTTYAFVFSIGMSFIPASVITFIVKERENNVKHQQVVSGVSLTAYWFANYFVDILKYMVPGIINSLIAMAFNATALIDGPKLGGLWAIFMLYGFCVVSFVYLISFLFRDYGTAQITSFFFNFGTGFIGGLAISILRIFDDTKMVAKILMWILRVLPTFSMTFGFLNLSNREIYALVDKLKVPLDVFDLTLVGGDVIYLACGAVIYLALVFLVEMLRTKQFFVGILSREKKVPYVPKVLDQDVEAEVETIENSDNQTYAIKVDKLRKVYAVSRNKHKVAVDRLSFGVKNGECFALLGVNGAGKTTTFKILSGDYLQTSGKAYINGFDIPTQLAEARHDIGYCPQFDALLDNLTAKEHLYLYAAVKGIPLKLRGRFVEKQLREMNLKQYENTPAGTYSGGNKRKLSVAIAMIGNPSVIFLDEPSTGMDPEARKFMRNVISKISKESKLSSIILTTHSMEEAEALATRIGIMVSGNLKCLGSSQHIKSKYGGGYEIEVKLNLPARDEVRNVTASLELGQRLEIEKPELDAVLGRLNVMNLKGEISETGSGSAIHTELKKGRASVNLIVEWAIIEKNGQKLKDFLKQNVGDFLVLEHFQSFFRFKTMGQVSIGKFFGSMEDNKKNLNIMQYSIRQSTIEQIFNAFAAEEAASEQQQHANLAPVNIETVR